MPMPSDTITGNPYTSTGPESTQMPRGASTADVEQICRTMIKDYDDARLRDEKRAEERRAKDRWKVYAITGTAGLVGGMLGTWGWHRIRYGKVTGGPR